MSLYSITAKLGNMRKAVDWVVYPPSAPGVVIIQSAHRICSFVVTTRNGLLSKSCSSGAYFMHLQPILGATPIEVPQSVIDAALAAQPKYGDKVGPGVTIG